MKKLNAILVSASFWACSCSAVRSVDDMKQNTDNMGRDTNKMSQQMTLTQQQMTDMNGSIGGMSDKIDGMANRIDGLGGKIDSMGGKIDGLGGKIDAMGSKIDGLGDKMDAMSTALNKMYGDLRMGDSLQARLKSLDEMKSTKLLAPKTAHASHFFISYEFQLWKGEGNDTDKSRLGLMDDAVREFATLAQKFMNDDARSVSVATEDNDMLNLYALALSLHMVNPGTQRILAEKKIPVVSMFDLIRDGLKAGADLKDGKRDVSDLKAYEASVLEYEEVFTYLLELRANMYPGMLVGGLSEANATNGAQKWWARANMFTMPWKAQTESKNLVQLRMYSSWVSEAATLKIFLRTVKKQARFDQLLIRILKNMRIPELNRSLFAAGATGSASNPVSGPVSGFLDDSAGSSNGTDAGTDNGNRIDAFVENTRAQELNTLSARLNDFLQN